MSWRVARISRYSTLGTISDYVDDVNGFLICVGFRDAQTGAIYKDTKFTSFVSNLRPYFGMIKIGYYFDSQAINEAEAVEEAEFVLSTISSYVNDFPVFFNIDLGNMAGTGRADQLDGETRFRIYRAFTNRVGESGFILDYNFQYLINVAEADEIGFTLIRKYNSTHPDIAGIDIDGWEYDSNYASLANTKNVCPITVYKDIGGWESEGDISQYINSLVQDTFVYTGKPIKPEVYNPEGLVLNFDYTVFYKYNVNVNQEETTQVPTVTVYGINSYSGSIDIPFYITPAQISGEVQLIPSSYAFTGKVVKPNVVIKGYRANIDYIVKYQTNVDVGEYRVTVIGRRNFTGELYGKFSITPREISEELFSIDRMYLYTGSQIRPEVTYNNSIIPVEFDANDNLHFNYGELEDEDYIPSLSLPDIDGGDTNEQEASVDTHRFEYQDLNDPTYKEPINLVDFDYDFDNYDLDFNEFAVIDRDGYYTREFDFNNVFSNYDIEYGINVDVGLEVGKVKITGKNNFTGSLILYFDIVRDYWESEFELLEDDFEYTGNEIKPLVRNTSGLKEGTHYTVSYSSNIEIGTGIATIIGIYPYTGVTSLEFNIRPISIEGIYIWSLEKTAYAYRGTPITPKVLVVSTYDDLIYNFGDVTIGEQGTGNTDYNFNDYDEDYSSSSVIDDDDHKFDFGTAEDPMGGDINYDFNDEDEHSAYETKWNLDFEFLAYTEENIDNCSWDLDFVDLAEMFPEDDDAIADMRAKKPTYSVTYQDNEKFGTGKAIITGTGYFTGTVILTFDIVAGDLSTDCICRCGTPTEDGLYDFHKFEVFDFVRDRVLVPYEDYYFDNESYYYYYPYNNSYIRVYRKVTGYYNYTGELESIFPTFLDITTPVVPKIGGISVEILFMNGGVIPEKEEEDPSNIDIVIPEKEEEDDEPTGHSDKWIPIEDLFPEVRDPYKDSNTDLINLFPPKSRIKLYNARYFSSPENYYAEEDRLSGAYYIYNYHVVENRVRVARIEEQVNLPGRNTGWINISDLKFMYDRDEYILGNYVQVLVDVHKYYDGHGPILAKAGEYMYIVAIATDLMWDFGTAEDPIFLTDPNDIDYDFNELAAPVTEVGITDDDDYRFDFGTPMTPSTGLIDYDFNDEDEQSSPDSTWDYDFVELAGDIDAEDYDTKPWEYPEDEEDVDDDTHIYDFGTIDYQSIGDTDYDFTDSSEDDGSDGKWDLDFVYLADGSEYTEWDSDASPYDFLRSAEEATDETGLFIFGLAPEPNRPPIAWASRDMIGLIE